MKKVLALLLIPVFLVILGITTGMIFLLGKLGLWGEQDKTHEN